MGVNLITPTHTLNEQSFIIPASTYANAAGLAQGINEFFAERFGWEISDGKPVAVRNGKISVYASASTNANLCAKNEANANSGISTSLSYNNNITVFWHVSSDEKTMYLSLKSGTSAATATLILAENTVGNVSVFFSESNGNGFSENTAAVTKAFPTSSAATGLVNENYYYSISKLPDFFNGFEFASLYRLNTAKIAAVRNQIVTFGEQCFRLIYADYNSNSSQSTIPWLAFPVAD